MNGEQKQRLGKALDDFIDDFMDDCICLISSQESAKNNKSFDAYQIILNTLPENWAQDVIQRKKNIRKVVDEIIEENTGNDNG